MYYLQILMLLNSSVQYFPTLDLTIEEYEPCAIEEYILAEDYDKTFDDL